MEEVIVHPLYFIRCKPDLDNLYVNPDGSLAFLSASYAKSHLFDSTGTHVQSYFLDNDGSSYDSSSYVSQDSNVTYMHFGKWKARLPWVTDDLFRRSFVPTKVNGYHVEFASRDDLMLSIDFETDKVEVTHRHSPKPTVNFNDQKTTLHHNSFVVDYGEVLGVYRIPYRESHEGVSYIPMTFY